ncbi:hypothetical protein ASZ90_018860 [hydrocarbon metagenome]|uniref:Cupin type-2 domain-containing protein n=1 Tax=hydrocarbon metagenome TaxID=938273 RepID=A0A0W8E551_9ZZZZ
MIDNLFKMPDDLPDDEVFESIIQDKGILIERIISTGQSSPAGLWYEQDRDEWVAVLQGEAGVWMQGDVTHLKTGDWLLIPAGEKHRVEYTSSQPSCIWLAVHGKLI